MTAAEGKGAEFVLTTTVAAARAARLPGGREGRAGRQTGALAPPLPEARGGHLAAKRAGGLTRHALPTRFFSQSVRTPRRGGQVGDECEPATVTAGPLVRSCASDQL